VRGRDAEPSGGGSVTRRGKGGDKVSGAGSGRGGGSGPGTKKSEKDAGPPQDDPFLMHRKVMPEKHRDSLVHAVVGPESDENFFWLSQNKSQFFDKVCPGSLKRCPKISLFTA
jgi:hypothetical protein